MTDKLRSKEDIRAAATEYHDRLWYYRATSGSPSAQNLAMSEAPRREMEAKYTDLASDGEFAYGEICGRLSALRWALGDDWDEPLDS